MIRDEHGDVLQTREQMLRGLMEENPKTRAMLHLRDMSKGQSYTFFDHELAAFMRQREWIDGIGGSYRITDAGRQALSAAQREGE